MAVTIRMSRHGARKRPFYRIVAAERRFPRDGRFLEQLGTYDPLASPEKLDVDSQKLDKWIQKGARLSDTVATLLKRRKAAGSAA